MCVTNNNILQQNKEKSHKIMQRTVWWKNFILMIEGGPKNSVKKNLFQTVVQVWNFSPFKVRPLWLDAVIPVLLPLLETLSKTFNGNAVTYCQWLSLNLCYVSKMPRFQIQIHPWEQKEVASSEVRWGVGGQLPFCFVAKREASCWRCRGSARIAGSPCSIFIEDCRQCFQQWEWHWDHCI